MNQTQRFKVLEKEDLLKIGRLRHKDNEPFYEKVTKKNIGYNKTCPSKMKGILEMYSRDLEYINTLNIETFEDFIIYMLRRPIFYRIEELSGNFGYISISNQLTKLNNNGTIRRIHHTSEQRIRSFEDVVCMVTTYFPEVHFLDIFKFIMKIRLFSVYKIEPYPIGNIKNSIQNVYNFSSCSDIKRSTVYIPVRTFIYMYNDLEIEDLEVDHGYFLPKIYNYDSVFKLIEMFDMLSVEEQSMKVKPVNILNFYKNKIKDDKEI